MNYLRHIFFLTLFSSLLSSSAFAQNSVKETKEILPIKNGNIVYELEITESKTKEIKQLQRYLKEHLLLKNRNFIPQLAELRIKNLSSYKEAKCQWRNKFTLSCHIERQILLRELRVIGLPLTLLKADLQKNIFLRKNKPFMQVDRYKKIKLERQKERINQFLQSKGFYGARLQSEVFPTQQSHLKDVIISISGGNFIRVADVVIENSGPWDLRAIKRSFSKMCITSSGVLEALRPEESTV